MRTRRIVALLALAAPLLVRAEDVTLTLDEVVVTATRIEEWQIDVPASVTVITSAEIESRGVTTVADAIEAAAGVAVSDHGGQGAQKTATIRGSTSSQVLVLVDGVRVSSAMSGFVDLSTIPADSIERIEVLRSSASALYGSDAVGGVINIITKRAPAPLELSLENGSFIPASHVEGYGSSKTSSGPDWASLVDSQKLTFSVRPSLGEALLRASGGFSRAANAYTFIDSSDERRIRENARLLAGNLSLGGGAPLFGGWLDADLGGTYQQNGVPGPLSWPSLAASQTNARATATLKFSTDRLLSDALTLDATAHAEYAIVDAADPGPPAETSDSRLFTAGGELQQTAFATDALTMVYGVSCAYDRGSSTEFGLPQRISVGAFLAPALRLGAVSLHPSLRYDYFSDYSPGALSGSLGATFKLSEKDALKASLSRSYRVPSFEDLYWPSGAGVEGNPDLDPETARSLDVGYERAAKGLSYRAFAYARYARDVILWQPGTDGIWRPSNFGAALYPGIEQELRIAFLDRFNASLSHTFLYSFVLDEGMSLADDKRVPMTPVHAVNATLGYAGDGLSWSVTARYQGLRFLKIANAAYLPEFLVVDAVLRKTMAKKWEASLAVDNLFGAQYQVVDDYPMPGASLRMGLTARF
jgi:vitamin B12 transporter